MIVLVALVWNFSSRFQRNELPYTFSEFISLVDSGQVVLALEDGEVTSVTGKIVTVQSKGGPRQYRRGAAQ